MQNQRVCEFAPKPWYIARRLSLDFDHRGLVTEDPCYSHSNTFWGQYGLPFRFETTRPVLYERRHEMDLQRWRPFHRAQLPLAYLLDNVLGGLIKRSSMTNGNQFYTRLQD